MLSKFKKIFLLLLKKKLFFFVLIIGGLLSPLYSAQAAFKWYYLIPHYWYIRGVGAITGWGTELIATKLGAFIAVFITMILQIPLFFANVFLWIAAVLLDLTTSPIFIDLSYTKLDNPIIRMGWTITRDLANMGIVLGLIVIGVATILRIEGYQAKKTLPVLIIIALLINFTPVLLGIVVDASNIFMNFFLQGSLETSGFIELMKNQGGAIVGAWEKATEAKSPADILAPLGETVALTFYGFIAGFIFIVFAFLFIMRYIAIWILVILSPLAFAAYILPATKKYFDQWWKQFLNWCFIGVWAAFFLYLSNGLLALATGQGLYGTQKLPIETITEEGGTPATTGLPGLLNDLLPYYVIIGFLVLGLVATLSISAYGASAIINFAKSKGKAAVRGTGRGVKWVGGKIAQKGIRPLLEKARTKEAVGKIARGVEKVPVLRWFMPEKARLYGQMRPAIDKAKAQAASYSSQTLAHRLLKKADVQTDAVGNLMTILERGDAQDLFNEAKKLRKWKGKSDQEILNDKEFQDVLGRPLDIAQKGGMHSDILRRDPRLAAIAATKGIVGYQGLSSQDAIKKAVNEARAQHISSWEPEMFENKDVIEAALGKFDRERWLQVNRTIKRGQDSALTGIDNAFKEFVKANKLEAEVIQDKAKVWGKYQDYIKKQTGGEGYFKSLEDKRVQQTGWRAAEYRPGISPGAAAMGGPPPTSPGTKYVESKVVHKPSPSDTGEARKEKRKEPDVGNP